MTTPSSHGSVVQRLRPAVALRILSTQDSYFRFLLKDQRRERVTEKGQVTIPERIRLAAGVAPGSEVSFSLDGSKIVITPVATGVRDKRREPLRAAAARVRRSLCPEFKQLGAESL